MGTLNFAQETATTYRKFAEEFVRFLHIIASQDNVDAWTKKCCTALADYLDEYLKLGKKRELYSASFSRKFEDDVLEELKKMDVPYFSVPTVGDKCLILVRDIEKDREALLTAQENAFARSTDFVKEISAQRMLSILKTKSIVNAKAYCIEDDSFRELAKERMYRCGITFAESLNEDAKKIVIPHPSSIFRRNGKDAAFFELDYALLQARDDEWFKRSFPHDLQDRLSQAAYDKAVSEEFAKCVMLKKNAVLMSEYGSELGVGKKDCPALVINDGEVFIIGTSDSEKPRKLDIPEGSSFKEIQALISLHFDNIRDAVFLKEEELPFSTEELCNSGGLTTTTNELFTSLRQNIAESDTVKTRPEATDKKMKAAMNSLWLNLRDLSSDASEVVAASDEKAGAGTHANQKAYKKKKDYIITNLKDPESEHYQTCLAGLTSRGTLDEDQARRLLSNLVNHFENTNEASYSELHVQEVSKKTLAKAIEVETNLGLDIEQDL